MGRRYPWGRPHWGNESLSLTTVELEENAGFYLLHHIHVTRRLQKPAAPKEVGIYFFFLHWHGKNNKFQRLRVENEPLWCEKHICVWSELHLRWQALWSAPLPSYTLTLIASLFCAHSFELRLKMKDNLVHSVSTVQCCCCLFSGTIRGLQFFFYFLFFTMLRWALCIIYHSLLPEKAPDLHSIFNWMPLLSASCVDSGRYIISLCCVFVVSSM